MVVPLFLEYLAVIGMGLVFGSFATALIYRIPRNIPWVAGRGKGDISAYRSVCPSCKADLGVADLIPVFSWLFLRGKCRRCQTKISPIYPVTELLVLAGCFGVYAVYGLSFYGVVLMCAVPFLAALLIIDMQHMILPDQLVLIVAALGLVSLGPQILEIEILVQHGLGAVIYAALIWGLGWLMTKILKKEALGFGDVKFFAAAGLWLGVAALPWFLMIAGVLGVAIGGGWRHVISTESFPFGPALIAALYALLLFQDSLGI